MERVSRVKSFIIATIACAVILIAAVFSVSFAAWSGGGSVEPVQADGSVGQFYVEYPRYQDGSSGGEETPDVALPERDLSKDSVKVEFSDAVIVFEMGNTIISNSGKTFLHIFNKSDTLGTSWPGLHMNKQSDDATNTVKLAFSYSDVGGIILSTDETNKQTGSGSAFFNAVFGGGLKKNITYTITSIKTHWNDFTNGNTMSESVLKNYFSVTEKAPEGGSTPTPGDDETENLYPKMLVRKMNGKTEYSAEKGGYVYRNYICVSRKNDVGDADNSLCFVEFFIEGTEDALATPVKNIKLTRAATNADPAHYGEPIGEYAPIAPRLYNYDPTVPTTLADIGHGNGHKLSDGSNDICTLPSNTNNMVDHFDKGMYCILFFGDHDQQYFALDIEIVTESAAEFTLTATASNENSWQRYISGYGEPWGYYMGGLINNVWLWDPRRTTKMVIESGAMKIDPDGAPAEGTYSSVKFGAKEIRYPNSEIDLKLTVNLAKDSLVKMYMLDESGRRLNDDETNNALYLIPNEIICTPGTMYSGKNIFDKELNLRIHEYGEYSFRFVGKIHLRGETVNGKTGNYVKLSDGTRANGKDGDANYAYINDYNLVIDKLYISRSDGDAVNTVTFDAGAGSFANGESTLASEVRFGNCVDRPEDPTQTDKSFAAWCVDETLNTEFDFATPITESITLFAKWEGKRYNITLDYNYIGAPDGSTVTTDTSGLLTAEQLAKPSRPGWTFTGWNTSADGTGIDVTETYVFDSDISVYAQWEEKQTYIVTFDANGGAVVGDQTMNTDTDGILVSLPTATKEHYAFDGWYTLADGGDKITTSTVFTENTTVYAHWSKLVNNYYLDVTDTVGETAELWLGTMTNSMLETELDILSGSRLVMYEGESIITPAYTVKPSAVYSYTAETNVFAQIDDEYYGGDTFTLIINKSGTNYTATIRNKDWFNTDGVAATPEAGDYYVVGNFTGDRPMTEYKLNNIHISAYRYNKTAFSRFKYDEYEVRYYTSSAAYKTIKSSTVLNADGNIQIYACAYNNDTSFDVRTSAPTAQTGEFRLTGEFENPQWQNEKSDYKLYDTPHSTGSTKQWQIAVYLNANTKVQLYCNNYGDKKQHNFQNYSGLGTLGSDYLTITSAGTYAFYYQEGETYTGSGVWNPIYVSKISSSNLT